MSQAPILFFDGTCGLCSGVVRWCLRRDRRAVLHFAPLQGATWAALVHPDKPSGLDTMVLLADGALHVRSDAVLRVARLAGGAWPLLAAAAGCLPHRPRDAAYDFIARRRLRWFGAADACRLPEIGERARFLP